MVNLSFPNSQSEHSPLVPSVSAVFACKSVGSYILVSDGLNMFAVCLELGVKVEEMLIAVVMFMFCGQLHLTCALGGSFPSTELCALQGLHLLMKQI